MYLSFLPTIKQTDFFNKNIYFNSYLKNKYILLLYICTKIIFFLNEFTFYTQLTFIKDDLFFVPNLSFKKNSFIFILKHFILNPSFFKN